MRIPKEMVVELNSELSIMGCPFRYKFNEKKANTTISITLPNMNYVDSYTINVTKEFLEWLKMWFKVKQGIEISCNNTGTTLWSKDGFEKVCDNC